jgi:hypothetical protein
MTFLIAEHPIASVDQFKHALLTYRDRGRGIPPAWLIMLCAQGKAPCAAMTATELADVAGYPNHSSANLNYGKLARYLAEILSFTPTEKHRNGEPAWWTTISTGIGADPDADKHFQFVMRPELLQALREMNWVKATQ